MNLLKAFGLALFLAAVAWVLWRVRKYDSSTSKPPQD